MAKRKHGPRKGFKLEITPDYRSERYTMYIMKVETGILQAATVAPELTDGHVNKVLIDLIERLQTPETLAHLLPASTEDEAEIPTLSKDGETNLVEQFILLNLRDAFDLYGPLSAEDVSGILGVIKTSVKRWGHGEHRRGYLTYIEGFLGQAGVGVRQLSADETKAMGLDVDPPEQES